ncbi:MAG: hypothetical protein HUJ68_00825 [Clostridia bacterium]|nr:hypothetical protein [Clostridia bacterium]
MGGRGYHNDVKGYLRSTGRTDEYGRVSAISNEKIDFILDLKSPNAPLIPEFSNSPNKIYALLNKDGTRVKSITIYDENHEQKFSIHLDHPHNGKNGPHVHSGMNTGRLELPLTNQHQKIIDEVDSIFNEWRSK